MIMLDIKSVVVRWGWQISHGINICRCDFTFVWCGSVRYFFQQNWNSVFSCRMFAGLLTWFWKEPAVHVFHFFVSGSLPWTYHHSSRKSWEQTDHTSIWFLRWVFKEIRKCKCLEVFYRPFWLSSSHPYTLIPTRSLNIFCISHLCALLVNFLIMGFLSFSLFL